ncbi:hypothetical protein FIBSPDRAFT_881680 [Athelia psychrophila]|uniref:Uncharacterized protein n=1 Tax=Athelia psychrophila TaxID=1759441 RepID=A0A166W8K8_9AGAM|nr:hypothetical protein FIBSPDRAFT_881680 [Fibularhizoctonia sp. CBS 109695]
MHRYIRGRIQRSPRSSLSSPAKRPSPPTRTTLVTVLLQHPAQREDRRACHHPRAQGREILERGLEVKEYKLRRQKFSETSSFGFGVREQIDMGVWYHPGIGIFRVDFYIILGRPGARVAERKQKKARNGFGHRAKKDATQAWFKQRFDGLNPK